MLTIAAEAGSGANWTIRPRLRQRSVLQFRGCGEVPIRVSTAASPAGFVHLGATPAPDTISSWDESAADELPALPATARAVFVAVAGILQCLAQHHELLVLCRAMCTRGFG